MAAHDALADENGKLLSEERMEQVRTAFQALLKLTNHERGLVLCWFCKGCDRYVGPGDSCTCLKDE